MMVTMCCYNQGATAMKAQDSVSVVATAPKSDILDMSLGGIFRRFGGFVSLLFLEDTPELHASAVSNDLLAFGSSCNGDSTCDGTEDCTCLDCVGQQGNECNTGEICSEGQCKPEEDCNNCIDCPDVHECAAGLICCADGTCSADCSPDPTSLCAQYDPDNAPFLVIEKTTMIGKKIDESLPQNFSQQPVEGHSTLTSQLINAPQSEQSADEQEITMAVWSDTEFYNYEDIDMLVDDLQYQESNEVREINKEFASALMHWAQTGRKSKSIDDATMQRALKLGMVQYPHEGNPYHEWRAPVFAFEDGYVTVDNERFKCTGKTFFATYKRRALVQMLGESSFVIWKPQESKVPKWLQFLNEAAEAKARFSAWSFGTVMPYYMTPEDEYSRPHELPDDWQETRKHYGNWREITWVPWAKEDIPNGADPESMIGDSIEHVAFIAKDLNTTADRMDAVNKFLIDLIPYTRTTRHLNEGEILPAVGWAVADTIGVFAAIGKPGTVLTKTLLVADWSIASGHTSYMIYLDVEEDGEISGLTGTIGFVHLAGTIGLVRGLRTRRPVDATSLAELSEAARKHLHDRYRRSMTRTLVISNSSSYLSQADRVFYYNQLKKLDELNKLAQTNPVSAVYRLQTEVLNIPADRALKPYQVGHWGNRAGVVVDAPVTIPQRELDRVMSIADRTQRMKAASELYMQYADNCNIVAHAHLGENLICTAAEPRIKKPWGRGTRNLDPNNPVERQVIADWAGETFEEVEHMMPGLPSQGTYFSPDPLFDRYYNEVLAGLPISDPRRAKMLESMDLYRKWKTGHHAPITNDYMNRYPEARRSMADWLKAERVGADWNLPDIDDITEF
jgi:hypothetical protein